MLRFFFRNKQDPAVAALYERVVEQARTPTFYQGFGVADTIDGRLGNDVIEGANGADVLTGGGGRDTFVWSAADGQPDTITDFDPREDRLAFARDVFGVPGGVFDTRVVAGSDTDLTGADLVISRRALDSVADVIAFVNAAPGGSNEGLFIVAQTSAGHTLLYYSASGTAADMNSVHALADLGAVSPNQIALSDFAYL